MSRIGKQPVPVPTGVDVTIDGQNVSVKGPKGTLELAVAEPITAIRQILVVMTCVSAACTLRFLQRDVLALRRIRRIGLQITRRRNRARPDTNAARTHQNRHKAWKNAGRAR